ncbi:sperm microtubule associated protein 2-like [Phaenicophaeus curvirostris]|uniref:sperm microtubule associated protein 2-like n=1 Tax=Phaenicophaeus curvirostris TaxID=33595 RepID=UPI0037F09D4F
MGAPAMGMPGVPCSSSAYSHNSYVVDLCQQWRKSDKPASKDSANSPVEGSSSKHISHSCVFLQFHTLAVLARLVWGNQETIGTRSQRVVTTQISPRTVALAKPKKDFGKNPCRPLFMYSCGRESTIWERPLLANFSLPSDRLLKLAEPKKYQPAYLEKRPRQSPEWPVSKAALNYRASPRILELARPKVLHPEFLMARELPTKVTNAAALARASSRIQQLAEPRIRKVTYLHEKIFPEPVIRPTSKFAQQAIASPRTVELAMAKKLHVDYVPLRDAEWPVTQAAKRAVATPRILELAQPCKRPTMDSVQMNLDAFTVKESAKKAICSARIQELARPIQR